MQPEAQFLDLLVSLSQQCVVTAADFTAEESIEELDAELPNGLFFAGWLSAHKIASSGRGSQHRYFERLQAILKRPIVEGNLHVAVDLTGVRSHTHGIGSVAAGPQF